MRQACWIVGLVATAIALVAALLFGPFRPDGDRPPMQATLAATQPPHDVPLGAFLGSDATGVAATAKFQQWLGGSAQLTVGRSYLPGDNWSDIDGDSRIIGPWAAWGAAKPERTLVLNVPMVAPNEGQLPDAKVATLLRQGASGAYDSHFRTLAQRLVAAGAVTTTIVLGWEMNGVTYSSRCRPDPSAWKDYWRRIVTTMRKVPGAQFRFDFAPSRGTDDIPWTQCYPGDDVVDIVGMDSYDQEPGKGFDSYVSQPYGLNAQVKFAADHHKPVSYPEWGLFEYGDDPDYVREMYNWFNTHDVAYESITDYCPHGVFGCASNPQSSDAYRELFSGREK